ncbi:winged helix-turn-helix transcriptional regulator [Candidatus Berkelbacteria bacterium]|nr:winged helix-turn-helix transcriptional regulator [Candidatus Berkelbacteria bacterium]
MKPKRELERYFKGVANHRRIEILLLIKRKPEITLAQIAYELDCNIKTISEHTRRLVQAGLVNKKYRGREVAHSLSPYGKKFIEFIKSF